MSDLDAPEIPPVLTKATGALAARPVLFKYCAEEVCSSRHLGVFSRFITALTKGGPGGVPKPMEAHSGNALRYVGDMLAWVHQVNQFVISCHNLVRACSNLI